jgi:hypothetical protein
MNGGHKSCHQSRHRFTCCCAGVPDVRVAANNSVVQPECKHQQQSQRVGFGDSQFLRVVDAVLQSIKFGIEHAISIGVGNTKRVGVGNTVVHTIGQHVVYAVRVSVPQRVGIVHAIEFAVSQLKRERNTFVQPQPQFQPEQQRQRVDLVFAVEVGLWYTFNFPVPFAIDVPIDVAVPVAIEFTVVDSFGLSIAFAIEFAVGFRIEYAVQQRVSDSVENAVIEPVQQPIDVGFVVSIDLCQCDPVEFSVGQSVSQPVGIAFDFTVRESFIDSFSDSFDVAIDFTVRECFGKPQFIGIIVAVDQSLSIGQCESFGVGQRVTIAVGFTVRILLGQLEPFIEPERLRTRHHYQRNDSYLRRFGRSRAYLVG